MKKWLSILLTIAMLLTMAVPAGLGESAASGNVLRADCPTNENISQGNCTVLGSSILRSDVRRVIFADTLDGAPADAWDVSEAGNGSVMAWTVPDGNMYDLYIAANGAVRANSFSAGLFWEYRGLESIDFGNAFVTSGVENMYAMFSNCTSLKELNLRDFDTSAVTSMEYMFFECTQLGVIYVQENFGVPDGTNIEMMFYSCDASFSYDDPNAQPEPTQAPAPEPTVAPEPEVTEAPAPAAGSRVLALAELTEEEMEKGSGYVFNSDLPRSSIISVKFMRSLSGANEDAWDVSAAGDGSVLAWAEPDASGAGFDLYIGADGGVIANQHSDALFMNYRNVQRITFNGNLDTSGVETMIGMFLGCAELVSVDLTAFDTANATDMYAMFMNCESLTYLDLSSFNTANVTDMRSMFRGCSSLGDIMLDDDIFIFPEVDNVDELLADMFYGTPIYNELFESGPVEHNNIIRSDFISNEEIETGSGQVLGSSIPRTEIAAITFLDSLNNMPSNAWDVSAEGNGSVMAWTVANGDRYDLYIGGEGGVKANEKMNRFFRDYANVTEINFNNVLDTSQTTTMSGMFYGCGALTDLDISGFEMSNVENLNGMFNDCGALENLILPDRFVTAAATNVNSLFADCSALRSVDASGFDTGNVTDFAHMFDGCSSLTEVDVSNFDTGKATVMNEMFANCAELSNLDVSNFNTSGVTDMFGMFYNCAKVGQLDVSGFDTSNVTDMSGMFYQCYSLTNIDVRSFNASNVTDMRYMFAYCEAAEEILFGSGFSTVNAVNMSSMFFDCRTITELDLRGFNTVNVTDMNGMFQYCKNLENIFVSDAFIIGSETDVTEMFDNCGTNELNYGRGGEVIPTGSSNVLRCEALTKEQMDDGSGTVLGGTISRGLIATVNFHDTLSNVGADARDVSEAGDGSVLAWVVPNGNLYDLHIAANGKVIANPYSTTLFHDYRSVTEINFNGCFDTSQVVNMHCFFGKCHSLTSVDVSDFVTDNVDKMSYMFYECKNLREVDLSSLNTQNVTTLEAMFHGCEKLRAPNLSTFNTAKVNNMDFMFSNCYAMTDLDLSSFDMSNVASTCAMFFNCFQLVNLNMENAYAPNVADYDYMFAECTNLINLKLRDGAVVKGSLKNGSNGSLVKLLQQKLIQMGYLDGSADGKFGNMTATAIKTFQSDMDLDVSGVADLNTQFALLTR